MVQNTTQAKDPTICAEVILLALEKKYSYKEIAEKVGVREATAIYIAKQHLAKAVYKDIRAENYRKSKLGSNNPMHGKVRDKHHNFGVIWAKKERSYHTVLKPLWYEGNIGGRRCQEARLLMCIELSIVDIPTTWHVHHIDGDATNNDIHNLALVTAKAHRRIHMRERRARENCIHTAQ